jgi:hypothetical protein
MPSSPNGIITRLRQVLAERRKALGALATAAVACLVYVVTGVQLDDATATALAGVLIAAVVHELPNRAPRGRSRQARSAQNPPSQPDSRP